jgi:hypothetical protein
LPPLIAALTRLKFSGIFSLVGTLATNNVTSTVAVPARDSPIKIRPANVQPRWIISSFAVSRNSRVVFTAASLDISLD